MMKRRNAEVGKMRRPMKKSKITEGFYGSTLLYLKFLILWTLVILADFILEFRFEFLWPFYLLLRSVYDSFKYQGLAFSVFFVCVALTSDMLCFFFIPVHWLFFAASTYVWVQYVWHTDKGICAPTIMLWMLFVYLEAAVRLRDVKHMPGHLDLCRPFAAHCIGYPVVTLGFGFKSYIGFRMRQRKQRDVSKENEFYLQLMQQALPLDTANLISLQIQETTQPSQTQVATTTQSTTHTTTPLQTKIHKDRSSNGHVSNGNIPNGVHNNTKSHHRKCVDKAKDVEHHVEHHNNHKQIHEKHHIQSDKQQHTTDKHHHHHTHSDKQQKTAPPPPPVAAQSNGVVVGAGCEETIAAPQVVEPEPRQQPVTSNNTSSSSRKREKREADKEREASEYLQRLEMDAKRLRSDLQSSRGSEQELRIQVASLTTCEKVQRGELLGLQREVEDLQCKLQSCNTSKSQDRQTINSLERRVADERRARTSAETQLAQERKNRKQEEVRAAQVAAQSVRGECTDACRQRRREMEAEAANLRSSNSWSDERRIASERENSSLVEQLRDTDLLVSALNGMQEKNQHLENSLSAETRIKLDLFSALGEAKRQIEIKESSLRAHEKEIEELKSKIAQVLAVMPNDSFGSPAPSSGMSRVRLAECSPGSTLDPNATAYTPKGSSSLITSTEA